ncbi:flavodoxin domain-containing protein [uncultured Acidaminococcus sp.]|uniref:flavodoxin domain-containing protein n=1 Tax=uncultured Acidaminococcus sp. TaxID=352152 RepID=UPI0029420C35|nr:flavodoxin domain-containing protein [uncultured Acidaminococcus sp.]
MIYYFSTTGNSLALARKLAAALGDGICSVTRTREKTLEGPAVGLVFPVYYGDVPANVQDFVRSHAFPEGAYVYALATCGSTWAGPSGPFSSSWEKRAAILPGAGQYRLSPTAPSA